MPSNSNVWTIDSIGEDVARIEVDGDRVVTLPAWLLPVGTAEGDVLRVSHQREAARSVLVIDRDPAATSLANRRSAQQLADTPLNAGVPPNDWSEENPTRQYESSAAAIAASGLFDLARLTGDPLRARMFRDYALNILDTLTGPEFLASETPGWEGILKHGSYHEKKGLGVDESVMWGEYFFLEACSKALDYVG